MRPGLFIALPGGLAAALGHAPFHLWIIALPGFAALIWSVAHAATGRGAFLRGWLGGAAYFAVTLHWIVEPFLVDAATHGWMAPFALILLAGGLALFWGAAGAAAFHLGWSPGSRAIALALTMTVAELLRGHVFTGFPWAMPAYIFNEPSLIWVARLTGSYGLTLLVLTLAAMLTLKARAYWAPMATLMIVAAIWTAGRSEPPPSADLGTVGVVHPNVPQQEKWDRLKVPEHVERLRNLTAKAATQNPDMIVLPEAAVVYPLDNAAGTLGLLSDAAGPAHLVTGINRREAGDWFNALVRLGPGGEIEETFDKVHLVPFGEYIPFKLGVLRALAATSSNGFTPGEAVRLIDTPLGRALPLICYEGIFPRHLFRAGDRPDYILLLTNDAWFGNFAGPQQHLEQARFRAVEQGLPVVRVANRGVSTVINRHGQTTDPLGLRDTDARVFPVPNGKPTLYARTGDAPLFLILLVTLGALWVAKRRNAIANSATSS
ncbi:MAG: apolipoprotein N-acyltransferase [Paracoccaceae bacterium]|nr:apolipoprotein N-acyltransferase [Paracoccaceae bacterium]